jgi:hypothetical protein
MRDIGYGSAQTFRAGVYIAATVSVVRSATSPLRTTTFEGVTSMQFGVYCGGSVIGGLGPHQRQFSQLRHDERPVLRFRVPRFDRVE